MLERLSNTDARYSFLESRRTLRGRPNPLTPFKKRKLRYKGDLKANTSVGGLEMNDYDVVSLHIPYGPGWTARRIDKLVYQTVRIFFLLGIPFFDVMLMRGCRDQDLGMNCK